MKYYQIFHTPEELGKLARAGRKSQKPGLRTAAPRANVGPDFYLNLNEASRQQSLPRLSLLCMLLV